jgi:myo-inositol-1(or 4)-monophosphatase
VALVVDVELVVDRVILQVGNETGDIDDRQRTLLCSGNGAQACHAGGRAATVAAVDDRSLRALLRDTAGAIEEALGDLDDWGLAGTRDGQHHSDLAADAAARAVLDRAGVGVLSEESGLHHADREIVVVLDPLDGSTNAARRIPWFATSLAAVDRHGVRAALVDNLVSGQRYEAVRGRGASLDDEPVRPSGAGELSHALIGLSGHPPHYLGWRQYRALGAAALDLCAVATGVLDGYVDCSWDAHGPWDYLGAMLVCIEAGAHMADSSGRPLVVLDHRARRTPVAAATPQLLEQLLVARASFATPSDEMPGTLP